MTAGRISILLTLFFILGATSLPLEKCLAVPSLLLRVIDTVATPGDTGHLGIYLTNRVDTVAAFELTLTIDRPDLITLLPIFDSFNTLTSGWEYISAVSTANGIKLTGVANLIVPFPVVPGILPSSATRLLIEFPFVAHATSDTVTNRTAVISFINNINEFGVANSAGQLIGLIQDTTWDSTCYHCTELVDGICISYVPSFPPCDSIGTEMVISNPRFDSTHIQLDAGSVTLLPNCQSIPLAGDVTGNSVVDAADLTLLHDFVQFGTPPLIRPVNADLFSDNCINWRDYEILDRYLRLGPDSVSLPTCGFSAPIRCCCDGRRGNVNNDQFGVIDLSDLSRFVGYLTGANGVLPCHDKADYDSNGSVDLQDLSKLVGFLTAGTPAPGTCP